MPIRRFKNTLEAADAMRSGGLCAHPTVGLWGIGADPRHDEAMRRLNALKGGAQRNGYITAAQRLGHFAGWYDEKPGIAALLQHRFAGPVTVIARAGPAAAVSVIAASGTVAMRIDSHPTVAQLSAALGVPMVSTSLNLPGQPPATDVDSLPSRLAEQLAGYIDTGPRPEGLASTLVDATGDSPAIVRPGIVDLADIVRVWRNAL